MDDQKFRDLNEAEVESAKLADKIVELRKECLNELIRNKETSAEFPFATFGIMNRKKITYSAKVEAIAKDVEAELKELLKPLVELQEKLAPDIENLDRKITIAKKVEEADGTAKIELLPSLRYVKAKN